MDLNAHVAALTAKVEQFRDRWTRNPEFSCNLRLGEPLAVIEFDGGECLDVATVHSGLLQQEHLASALVIGTSLDCGPARLDHRESVRLTCDFSSMFAKTKSQLLHL